MSYHIVIALGNLGRDPEMRYTQGGQAVTNFSIAVDDGFQDSNGQWQKRTAWMKVTAWGKLGEFANNYLKKGRKVLVEGRLNFHYEQGQDQSNGPQVWTAQDGTSKCNLEIVASKIKFADSKDGGNGAPATATSQSVASAPPPDDGIPF
jgi:single-strand DNA-binding protein